MAPFIDCIICSLLRTVYAKSVPAYSSVHQTHLYSQGYGLQLGAHLVELLNIPCCNISTKPAETMYLRTSSCAPGPWPVS